MAERDQWFAVSVGAQHFGFFLPGMEIPLLEAMWPRMLADKR